VGSKSLPTGRAEDFLEICIALYAIFENLDLRSGLEAYSLGFSIEG